MTHLNQPVLAGVDLLSFFFFHTFPLQFSTAQETTNMNEASPLLSASLPSGEPFALHQLAFSCSTLGTCADASIQLFF